MIDCEKYAGRMRSICEGKERDGSPLKMSPAKRKAYLERWEGKATETRETRQQKAATWLAWLAIFRKDTDRGVGDVIERVASVVGGRLLKRILASLGITCGCSDRQAKLNQLYPFA